MRLIREPAIASRGEWARALVALLIAAGLVVWAVAHMGRAERPVESDAPPLASRHSALLSSLDGLQVRADRLDARRMLAMDAGVACRAACPLEPARIVFKGDTVECACRRVVLP